MGKEKKILMQEVNLSLGVTGLIEQCLKRKNTIVGAIVNNCSFNGFALQGKLYGQQKQENNN